MTKLLIIGLAFSLNAVAQDDPKTLHREIPDPVGKTLLKEKKTVDLKSLSKKTKKEKKAEKKAKAK